jgi:D-sedoheptulose 7-phosphate isomerase
MLKTGVVDGVAERIGASLRARTPPARRFFGAHGRALAEASLRVAERLGSGGRIYAFGTGPYATDAQHVAVEFVHPVLVGKPALPAADLSASFEASLPVLAGKRDVALGFGPPDGDARVTRALAAARERGAFTIAWPGSPGDADFALPAADDDEHLHQELFEIAGHLLYESVHVFLEHRPHRADAGASSFLYPFLGGEQRSPEALLERVTESIAAKVEDARALRERVAAEESGAMAAAARTIATRLRGGGRLLLAGNGGSATDAADWALDCVAPPRGLRPVPALSLASEAATLTAIANDVGREFVFSRQLIAHAGCADVFVALSTSGGSANVICALEEARKRGSATIGLLGYDGGEILRRRLADHAIVVRSDYVPRVQEAQAAVYHTLRHALEWVCDGA